MAGNRKDSPVAGKRDLKRQILARWQLYLLLLLPLIYIAVFAYVPMGGLVIAFKKYNVRQGIWGRDLTTLSSSSPHTNSRSS